jgi:hypothetical protein
VTGVEELDTFSRWIKTMQYRAEIRARIIRSANGDRVCVVAFVGVAGGALDQPVI